MKTTMTFSNALTMYPFGKSTLLSKKFVTNDYSTFEEFTPTPMKENEVAPPQHVWENIAKILDAQDHQNLRLTSQGTTADRLNKNGLNKYIYASVLVGIAIVCFWYYRNS